MDARLVVAAVALVGLAPGSGRRAADRDPPVLPAPARLESVMPAAELRPFAPVDPRWKLLVEYTMPDGRITTAQEALANPAGYRVSLYFHTRPFTRDSRPYEKLLVYDEKGQLRTEVDWRRTPMQIRTRRLDGSGRLTMYGRSVSARTLYAISLTPDGKQVVRIVGGTGRLVSPTHLDAVDTWVHDGCAYLTRHLNGGLNTQLALPNGDTLWVTDAETMLTLRSHGEIWTRLSDGTVELQPRQSPGGVETPAARLSADAIHRRVLDAWAARESGGFYETGRLAQWKLDYAARFAEFSRAYRAYLRSIGKTAEGLGVAGLLALP